MRGQRKPTSHPSINAKDVANLYKDGRFDAAFYAGTYPDVGYSGLDPAVHFLWLGARLGRLGHAQDEVPSKQQAGILDALFIDGTNGTSSTPYRIDRVAEGLRHLGANVRTARSDELGTLAGSQIQARYVIFFRATYWPPNRAFAQMMRARGARIVFDVDDLVFDEEEIPFVDGYRCLTEDEKIGYTRGVKTYREFILAADFCTAPTHYLVNSLKKLGKKAFRVRNSLDRSAIERLYGKASIRSDDKFVVGYYSGSRTHQADFRNAGAALIRLMNENPAVTFRLVGDFDLREYPQLLQRRSDNDGRIIQRGLLPHSRMLDDQLECDVILAPLEVGNPFCEAKSELKFFEAALAGRPVIASPTDTFRSATLDGKLAQLADTPEEWLRALRNAFSDRERMAAMAARACEYVVKEYSPEAAGKDAVRAYNHQVAGQDEVGEVPPHYPR